MLHSWINEFHTEKRVRWPDVPFPRQECLNSAIPRDTWNQRSARPRWKNHEIQTQVHCESNDSLGVCPVVEDEMDEEDMDD